MGKNSKTIISEDCNIIFSSLGDKLEKLNNSSVYVTGGSGFLGSWVYEIINFLNLSLSYNIKLYLLDRKPKPEYIALSKNIEYLQADVRSISDIPEDVNYIIHAASSPDSKFNSINPLETMTSITEGTTSILHVASRLSDLKNFLFVSSSDIYSHSNQDSISEDSAGVPFNLSTGSFHSEAKRYAEMICGAARNEVRMPITTIRPFTFCGPYQSLDAPWAINNFINDIINDREIKILGDGSTLRSYMYGSDFAAWCLVIMLEGQSGEIFNVGSNDAISLLDLAKKVSDNSFKKPNILTNTSLTESISSGNLVPSILKAQDRFKLSIYTSIDEAINKSIRWYEDNL